ncbi:C1q-like domain-containing protein [Hyphomicrobium sp. DY-1]|uniref:C1q-like domain-containing protein n=1 Tax=Hyphomicrobium sp. DY-1 TaxID=3075650 RepID=UPI0039C13DD5
MTLTVRSFGAMLRVLTLLVGLLLLAESANAACTSPAASAGDMTYSNIANTMVFCDGQNWVSMAGGVSLTVNTSGGGTATPAGSASDVQFNDGTKLAADTGNFTYSAGLFKAPNISTTNITATGAGNFGTINSSGLGTLGSLIVTGGATITGQASITTISTSLIQVGGNGAACTSSLAGGVRYNSTSNTMDYCSGSAWLSLGPSATVVPAVLVTMSANQTIAASTAAALNLDTKAFDTNNNYDTSTQKFTPTIPGYYQVNTAVTCASATSVLNACIGYLSKNGVTLMAPVNRAGETGSQWTSAGSIVVYMNGSTDYLQLKGFTEATGGGILSGSNIGGTFFSAALLTMNSGGSGGTATPAGSTADVQFNNAGALAVDTGNFTYASSTLKTPSLLTGGITATGQASLTTVSSTLIQLISNTITACSSNLAGAQRYNSVSNTIDYCTGTGWMSLGPSSTLPVAFMVNKGGTDQTIATNTHVKLTFSTKELDTNNNFNTSTGRFTVTIPGVYLINASVTCSGAATNCQAEISKNGTYNKLAITQNANTGTGTSQASAVMYLAAGDYIEGGVWSTAATTVVGATYDTYLDGVLISASGGGSGGSTPAGSTNDIQFNSGGLLAADTGNFTYASSTLHAPSILTGGLTATGQASLTTVSTTLLQLISNTTTACTTGLAGAQRFNSVSNTIDYCTGTAWMSMGPSSSQPVSFLATMSANQTVTTNTTTKVAFNTKRFDTNNNFDTTNYRFTPTIPGKYLFIGAAFCSDATTSCYVMIYKDGVVTAQTNVGVSAGATPKSMAIVDMNGASDYVEVYASNNGGTTISNQPYVSYFSGVLLSPQGSGGANPAGSTNDIQFNSGGLLAADTGNFTYASSTLHAPSILTGGLTATGQASLTTVSSTLVQLMSNTTTACTAGLAGGQRYNTTNQVIEFCNGTSWTTVGPSFGASLTAFTALVSTNQTVTNNSVVHWNLTITNNGNAFDTSTGKFTAPATGLYYFIATLLTANDKTFGDFVLYKNGVSASIRSYDAIPAATNTAAYAPSALQGVLYLVAGDVVDIRNVTGSSETVEGSVSRFSGFMLNAASGSGGTSTPAGSTGDVQFNSGGLLAADTGNFTYASSTLHTPSLLTGGLTATGQASLTTVSSTLVQLISNTTTACTTGLAGSQRYNSVSNTIDYCTGSGWLSLGPSATVVPSFYAISNNTTSVPNNTATKLDNLGTVKFDTNGNYANSRFTVTIPGTYIFTASARFASNSSANWLYITKNGTPLSQNQTTAAAATWSVNGTLIDRAVAGDYYEVYVQQNTGSTMTMPSTGAATYFGGSLLSMNGSGGTANPAGTTNDVQFNSAGLLAVDTGNFTYASSTLHTPSILTGGLTATGQASLTTVSTTLLQMISNTTTDCTSNLAGAQRYNGVSNTIDYCTGTAWMSMGPSSTQPISFSAAKNSAQALTALTWQQLTGWTEEFDTNNNFASDSYTVTVPGKYLFNVGSRFVLGASGGVYAVGIYKNGVQQKYVSGSAGANDHPGAEVSVILDGAAGDVFTAYVYVSTSGDSVYTSDSKGNFFSGVLLSPQGGGSGGTANPAGSTADIQFNTGGLLDADAGKFTYAKATGTISVTTVSTTIANFVSASTYANVVGGLGNMISSGSAVVSTSSAGGIGLFSGGSQRMSVDSGGNVMIGTSTPSTTLTVSSSTGLTVTNGAKAMIMDMSGSGNDFRSVNAPLYINNAFSNASATIINARSGNVFIGEASNWNMSDGVLRVKGVPGSTAGMLVDGNTTANFVNIRFANNNGSVGTITTNGTTTGYNTSSDRRVKENITETREGLQQLMRIPVRDFAFRKDPSHTIVNGFIAQELNKVYPEAVTTNGDNGEVPLKDSKNIWQVDYGRITPLIVKSVQDLKIEKDSEIESLTTQLKAANDNIRELRDEMRALKSALRR